MFQGRQVLLQIGKRNHGKRVSICTGIGSIIITTLGQDGQAKREYAWFLFERGLVLEAVFGLRPWCVVCGVWGVWCVMRESGRFGGKEKWWICSPTKKYHLCRRNYFIIVRSQLWGSLAVNYLKFMNQNYCFTNTKFQNHLVYNYLLSDQ